jgi:PhnB protein
MHARIQLGENFIMGSDSPPERFEAPAGVLINLTVTDPAEAERLYLGLSEKAQIFMPLGETFWAKKFAMLKDQFGVSWMINCEKESY